MKNSIFIKNANENNLKNLDVEIPKNKLVVITGVSGSGKSSLAFDVLYNEGRRRYTDSLSAYARQFLGGTHKPDVESIEGLQPAIAVNQSQSSNNPRSTVGTTTEIYDYLRLLFARVGVPYCPVHNIKISKQSTSEIQGIVLKKYDGRQIQVLSPVVQGEKGTHKKLLIDLNKEGFLRVVVNGDTYKLTDKIILNKNKKHEISILIDRVKVNEKSKTRIFEAIEIASQYSNGLVSISQGKDTEVFSKNFACKHGDFNMTNIEPRLFSFNSHVGACDNCAGIGSVMRVTWDTVSESELSILDGGIKYIGIPKETSIDWQRNLLPLIKYYKIDVSAPIKTLTKKQKDGLLYGADVMLQVDVSTTGGLSFNKKEMVKGLSQLIEDRHESTTSEWRRKHYSKFLTNDTCDSCNGARLNEQALSVRVEDKNISQVTSLPIGELVLWIEQLSLTKIDMDISKMIRVEINSRSRFLDNLGLGYLTLDRQSRSLSGGESQRIRLASQLGSRLAGVIYVLDEPSIGLHQRDNTKLINSLKEMRDLGNTVVVIEHDEETMMESDYIIDIGPGAGEKGGTVVGAGTPTELSKMNTPTGRFLSGKDSIKVPETRRKGNGKRILVRGAEENNLKKISVEFPLGKLIAVTGVSGSGKSTLVNSVLHNALFNHLTKGAEEKSGKHKDIEGKENIDKVVRISQRAIGKTSRSNPATYTGLFDDVRTLFEKTKEAQIRGYNKGRFSFNTHGGRCEKCNGDGHITVSMHFLPDVQVVCDECNGKRYNEETLQVEYKGKNISDVLSMSVDEAYDHFKNIPKMRLKLELLRDVGLGYIKLGHKSTILSGGEAQRVKLATHLQKKLTGKTLFVMDEPTTGLHNKDIELLLKVINKIVENGDTVVLIEHNIDVIKTADYIIDMGPEGGVNGGNVIAKGTPEQVSKNIKSDTGKYLKYALRGKNGIY